MLGFDAYLIIIKIKREGFLKEWNPCWIVGPQPRPIE